MLICVRVCECVCVLGGGGGGGVKGTAATELWRRWEVTICMVPGAVFIRSNSKTGIPLAVTVSLGSRPSHARGGGGGGGTSVLAA